MAGIGQCKHCGQPFVPVYDENNKVIYKEHQGSLPCIIYTQTLEKYIGHLYPKKNKF